MDDTHERDDGTEEQMSGSRVDRRWFLGSTATVATLGLAGCTNTDSSDGGGDGGSDGSGGGGDGSGGGGDGSGGGGDGSDNGGGESPEPLKIGALFPTSGPYASAGKGMRQSAELAVSRFDGSVSGREVDFIVRDTATDPKTAINEANTLINQEDIDLMVGGFSSSVCLALQDVAGRTKVPYFSGGGSSLKVNGQNCNKYSFFAMASGWQFSGAGLTAYKQDILDSLFFVQADYAGGEGVYQGVTSVMKSQTDAEMKGRALAQLGNDDYSSQITKARESGADTVWAALVGGDTIRFIKQAVSAGLYEDMNILVGIVGNYVAKAISDNALSKIYGGANFYWTADGSGDYAEEFKSQTGSPPEWWSAVTFDATMEALTAIEKANGSAAAADIIPAVEGRKFSWSRPSTRWRSCDHRAVQPYYLMKGNPSGGGSGKYWDIIGKTGGEQIMRSCDQTGCSL